MSFELVYSSSRLTWQPVCRPVSTDDRSWRNHSTVWDTITCNGTWTPGPMGWRWVGTVSKRIKRLQKVWVGLPKRIKVGPGWYAIQFEEELRLNGRRCLGVTDEFKSEVALDPDQSYSQSRNTVVHELFHCIRSLTLIGNPHAVKDFDDLDETIALQYGPYMLMILQDNPELVEWLQKPEEAADESNDGEVLPSEGSDGHFGPTTRGSDVGEPGGSERVGEEDR